MESFSLLSFVLREKQVRREKGDGVKEGMRDCSRLLSLSFTTWLRSPILPYMQLLSLFMSFSYGLIHTCHFFISHHTSRHPSWRMRASLSPFFSALVK